MDSFGRFEGGDVLSLDGSKELQYADKYVKLDTKISPRRNLGYQAVVKGIERGPTPPLPHQPIDTQHVSVKDTID